MVAIFGIFRLQFGRRGHQRIRRCFKRGPGARGRPLSPHQFSPHARPPRRAAPKKRCMLRDDPSATADRRSMLASILNRQQCLNTLRTGCCAFALGIASSWWACIYISPSYPPPTQLLDKHTASTQARPA